MKSKLFYPMLFALILLSLTSIYLFNQVRSLSQTRLVWFADEEIVNDAKQRLARIEQMDAESAMKGRYVVVMRFPDKRCVALQLEKGWVGAEQVFCYRKSDDKLVEEYLDEM